jgi:hypothetical protein
MPLNGTHSFSWSLLSLGLHFAGKDLNTARTQSAISSAVTAAVAIDGGHVV